MPRLNAAGASSASRSATLSPNLSLMVVDRRGMFHVPEVEVAEEFGDGAEAARANVRSARSTFSSTGLR